MIAAAEQARPDLLQVAHEIGKELLRHPETLRTLRLGVLRIEKNVHAGSIELKVPADRQGGDAAPAYEPEAEQGQDKAITILDLTLLMAVAGQTERFVHQLDAEVEGLPRRDQPVEAILRLCAGGKARLDRGQPAPITLWARSGVRRSRDCRRHGDRGRPDLGAEVVDEGAHPLGRDAVGWRLQEVGRIALCQEAKPAPIGGPDHPARSLCEVSPGPAGLVEDVAGFIGRSRTPRCRPLATDREEDASACAWRLIRLLSCVCG